MTKPWFRSLGWVGRPMSWEGYLISLVAIAFCVQVFVAIDRHSHSVSDTLYGAFPYFANSFLLVQWVASKRGAD